MTIYLSKWNQEYFDFEAAFISEACVMKRISRLKIKIGDTMLVMLTKGQGIRWIARVMSNPVTYVDDDPFETDTGRQRLGNQKCNGVYVKLERRLNIEDYAIREHFETLGLKYRGPWSFRKLTPSQFDLLITPTSI
jgi:hypothetical protein